MTNAEHETVTVVSYRALRRLLRSLYPDCHAGVWMAYLSAAEMAGNEIVAEELSQWLQDKLCEFESVDLKKNDQTAWLAFASDIAAVEFKLTYADALED